MGRAGSDLALESADAVIVRDELTTLPAVIAQSRRARRIVIANLAIAFTFITVLGGPPRAPTPAAYIPELSKIEDVRRRHFLLLATWQAGIDDPSVAATTGPCCVAHCTTCSRGRASEEVRDLLPTRRAPRCELIDRATTAGWRLAARCTWSGVGGSP